MTRLITGIALGIGGSLAWHVGRWIAEKRRGTGVTRDEPLEETPPQHCTRTSRLHEAEDGVAENPWDR